MIDTKWGLDWDLGSKLCREKRSFSPKFFGKSNSAAAAEFKNGVIFEILYVAGKGENMVMFRMSTIPNR